METSFSNARVFFDEIFREPERSYQKLERLVVEQAQENEWREFKGTHHLTHLDKVIDAGKKAEELRNIWSKMIGAFANSSGGVLIWGIDAPNRVAVGLSLAKDADELADKLIGWVSDAVLPHVHGIEIKAVKKGAHNEGLVVCLVPASLYAPHQSNWPRREFYMRCQDGSHQCGYAELKRLFQPRTQPILVPTFYFEASPRVVGGHSIGGEVRIKNIGTASAVDVLVNFQGPGEITGEAASWERIDSSSLARKKAIHPGQSASLQIMPFVSPEASYPEGFCYTFKTTVYAADTLPFVNDVKLDWHQFMMTGTSKPIRSMTIHCGSTE